MIKKLIVPSAAALQIFRRSTWPSYTAADDWKPFQYISQYIYNISTKYFQYIYKTFTIHLQNISNTLPIHFQYILSQYFSCCTRMEIISNMFPVHFQYCLNIFCRSSWPSYTSMDGWKTFPIYQYLSQSVFQQILRKKFCTCSGSQMDTQRWQIFCNAMDLNIEVIFIWSFTCSGSQMRGWLWLGV